MANIDSTLTKLTEFAGDYKIVHITGMITSASDAITITEATHGISEITAILGTNLFTPLGTGAGTTSLGASYSGLVITVTALEGDGTASAVFQHQYGITLLGK